MATKKKQAPEDKFLERLAFNPVQVQLLIQGYGGEAYAGRVDRKMYDFFAKHKYDISEYAGDWDGDWTERIPRELQPFPPGSPYECDGLWHASGAELDSSNQISLTEVTGGREIWTHSLGCGALEDAGVTVQETGGTDLDELDENEVVFWGGQGEKGCFFDCEFTLRAPFDPKKLIINYENCDGWFLVTSVEYDGEELDGSGGYSTTGKWAEHKFILLNGEEVFEAVPWDEREENDEVDDDWDPAAELDKIRVPELEVSDWFPVDTKPAYKGTYEAVIDAPWPLSGIRMVEWTGRSWKENGKKVAIKEWRGLAKEPVGA